MKLVFTNGCFDMFHPGHLFFLERAKMYGDVLVVGINSDASICKIKGGMPVVQLGERIKMLEALRVVDKVIPFDEDTPFYLVAKIRPDVLVQSKEYENIRTPESRWVAAQGGKTVYIERIPRWSTTGIRARFAVCS